LPSKVRDQDNRFVQELRRPALYLGDVAG
jgi:hypothetical protein